MPNLNKILPNPTISSFICEASMHLNRLFNWASSVSGVVTYAIQDHHANIFPFP